MAISVILGVALKSAPRNFSDVANFNLVLAGGGAFLLLVMFATYGRSGISAGFAILGTVYFLLELIMTYLLLTRMGIM